MPRFWKALEQATKRPSLAAIARAWAGFEESAPAKADIDAKEMKALREALRG